MGQRSAFRGFSPSHNRNKARDRARRRHPHRLIDPHMQILHIITALERGGAEAMLEKLVTGGGRHGHAVVSLRELGPIGAQIAARGIEVRALHLGSATGALTALPRLMTFVRTHRPDVIQGWMDHGNLVATFARGLAARGSQLVWNVRRSLDSAGWDRFLLRRLVALNVKLAGKPERIVYNSTTGARQHEAIGYPANKRSIIPNGFDLARFSPITDRRKFRHEMGVADDELLIGLIARFHPCKNHGAFFQAAAHILGSGLRARFLFAGAGMTIDNPDVAAPLRDLGIIDRTFLLGERNDVPVVTAALDIACNVSHGEGFPNAVGEAMACAVPCVVTDVGDCRHVLGDTGVVCDSNGSAGIERALTKLIEAGPDRRGELGRLARARVEALFSLAAIVHQYDALYDDLAGVRRQPPRY